MNLFKFVYCGQILLYWLHCIIFANKSDILTIIALYHKYLCQITKYYMIQFIGQLKMFERLLLMKFWKLLNLNFCVKFLIMFFQIRIDTHCRQLNFEHSLSILTTTLVWKSLRTLDNYWMMLSCLKLNLDGQILLFGLHCGIFAQKSDILTIIALYNGYLRCQITKWYKFLGQ